MKKTYVAPECSMYVVRTMTLCNSIETNEGTAASESGGFSKGFAGGVEEDDGPLNLWGEE